jgi:ABC-2 type transport system ATP-binding protein
MVPAVTSTSDIAVELRDVWKIYHQRQRGTGPRQALRALWRPQYRLVEALRGVSLSVRRGEIVAYAGPNGAGKSTTVKLLAGLLAPTRGQVRGLGHDPIADRVGYVARIGVVFGQRTELWWDQPVAATFEWKRTVWRVPAERYRRMLASLQPLLGLDELMGSLARQLSLGQRMRADLALALLHEPELLFLDEPTLGLDVLAKHDILAFIKQLNQRHGVTVIVTSHDMDDLEQLAGRIVMIQRGELAFDGPFDQLRRRFADRRRLVIVTERRIAPQLTGAELIGSEGERHTFTFDASTVNIAALLAEAATADRLVDVETHRAPIDEVIVEIYRQWQAAGAPSADG